MAPEVPLDPLLVCINITFDIEEVMPHVPHVSGYGWEHDNFNHFIEKSLYVFLMPEFQRHLECNFRKLP